MRTVTVTLLLIFSFSSVALGSNYFLDSDNVFHVSPDGNDSNGGKAQQYPVNLSSDAFATIGKAITDANDGDTIIIWPGDYTEEFTISEKLTLIGTSRRDVVIGKTTSPGLKTIEITADGVTLKSLSVINKSGTALKGVEVKADDVTFEDCYIEGTVDGIWCDGTQKVERLRVIGCHLVSGLDALQLAASINALIVDTRILAHGEYSTGYWGIATALCCSNTYNAVFRNCTISAIRSDNNDVGCIAADISGNALFDNCSFYANSTGSLTDEGTYTKSYAVYCRDDSPAGGLNDDTNVLFNHCQIYADASDEEVYAVYTKGSDTRVLLDGCLIEPGENGDVNDIYSIYQDSNSVVNVNACMYDPNLTSGTITKL